MLCGPELTVEETEVSATLRSGIFSFGLDRTSSGDADPRSDKEISRWKISLTLALICYLTLNFYKLRIILIL